MSFNEHYSINSEHYDDIPDAILQGEKTILEFGPATGINHLISRHRDFFIDNNNAGRYLGIDIIPYKERYLTIEKGDIRDFETDKRFDIVLALHVLEHIEISDWPHVIEKLTSWVALGGYLIIGTPHKEFQNITGLHLVLRITPETIKQYLPDSEVSFFKTRYHFAEDGARFSWALLRYIWRQLKRHPYVKTTVRILAIWRNEE